MGSARVCGTRLVMCSCVAVALVLGTAPMVRAQQATTGWSITPYAWVAGLKGEVGSRGITGDVDLRFADIVENLDFVLAGVLEVRGTKWAGRVDVFYLNLSDANATQTRGGTATGLEAEIYQTMIAPEVGYVVFARPTATVEGIVGARYWNVKTELTTTLGANTGVHESSSDWVDGYAGANLRATPWSPRWHVLARADAGAGGSDFTWQLAGGATFDISRCCSLGVIYRHLDVDYESTSLVNNVATSGPTLTFGFRF